MKKVALVSGSSRGIGKSIALELANKGFITYVNGSHANDVDKTVKDIGKNTKPIISDLLIPENIGKAIKLIIDAENKLDLVVANIGSGKSLPGFNVPVEEYKKVFDVNLFGCISLFTEAIKFMKSTGGNLIAITSIAGCEILKGPPIPYTIAKASLIAYTKALSKEVAHFNIRVNAISPGNVMHSGSVWERKIKENKDGVEDYINKNVPLKTFIKPESIARAVMFLIQSENITGTNIIIDAGQTNKF